MNYNYVESDYKNQTITIVKDNKRYGPISVNNTVSGSVMQEICEMYELDAFDVFLLCEDVDEDTDSIERNKNGESLIYGPYIVKYVSTGPFVSNDGSRFYGSVDNYNIVEEESGREIDADVFFKMLKGGLIIVKLGNRRNVE